MSAIRAFQRKLEKFQSDIQVGGLLHFQKLKRPASETQHHNYVEFLDKLIENFEIRFGDFLVGKLVLLGIDPLKSIHGEKFVRILK